MRLDLVLDLESFKKELDRWTQGEDTRLYRFYYNEFLVCIIVTADVNYWLITHEDIIDELTMTTIREKSLMAIGLLNLTLHEDILNTLSEVKNAAFQSSNSRNDT